MAMTRSVLFELIAASYALCAFKRPGSNFSFDGRRGDFLLMRQDSSERKVASLAIFAQPASCGQFFQQRPGFDQVLRVEAFGEPIVDGRQQVARGISLSASGEESGQRRGAA